MTACAKSQLFFKLKEKDLERKVYYKIINFLLKVKNLQYAGKIYYK
jgi:hypothetical protein